MAKQNKNIIIQTMKQAGHIRTVSRELNVSLDKVKCVLEEYIVENRKTGKSYEEIALSLSLSRERVRQIIRSHMPREEELEYVPNTNHGMSDTKTYQCWNNMLSRCTNPGHPEYPRYGGRGVSVCEEWYDFRNFHRDMGTKPDGLYLDRIDNDGNYEPGNCRWVTRAFSSAHRRNTWSDEVRIEVKVMYETGSSYKQIYEKLGVSDRVARKIIHGK